VVAIIVVGPKELPRLMRTFGHYLGKVRHMAADFQRQFEEAVRDSEIDEVRKAMQDFHAEVSDVTPRGTVDKPLMMPTPAEPAPAAAEAAPPAPKPKPRTKKPAPAKTVPTKTVPAKTAAAKSKTPKPRAKKREEGAS
jgi:sec-independent protein translocase protein TatB